MANRLQFRSEMLPPIHHLGYVVEDLHRDVPRFAAATGAGPFYAMEHILFDEVTYRASRPSMTTPRRSARGDS